MEGSQIKVLLLIRGEDRLMIYSPAQVLFTKNIS